MVDAGDTVLLDLGDGPREVEVKGVMHNYTSHAAYLSAQAYEAAFGEAPAWSLVLGRNPRGLSKAELTRALTEASVLVTGVSVPADEAGPYEDVASGLDSVVGILLASSGALAFIVVYALTEMNVEEREREIATLKVLGRTRREVRSCVFRETWALAALGLVLGLPFGAALADHVMRSAEFDNVIFYRSTSPWCFLAAAVFTLACSAAALLLMRRRVDGVRMGESLKSVD